MMNKLKNEIDEIFKKLFDIEYGLEFNPNSETDAALEKIITTLTLQSEKLENLRIERIESEIAKKYDYSDDDDYKYYFVDTDELY